MTEPTTQDWAWAMKRIRDAYQQADAMGKACQILDHAIKQVIATNPEHVPMLHDALERAARAALQIADDYEGSILGLASSDG